MPLARRAKAWHAGPVSTPGHPGTACQRTFFKHDQVHQRNSKTVQHYNRFSNSANIDKIQRKVKLYWSCFKCCLIKSLCREKLSPREKTLRKKKEYSQLKVQVLKCPLQTKVQLGIASKGYINGLHSHSGTTPAPYLHHHAPAPTELLSSSRNRS